MARIHLDQTGNESLDLTLAKLNDMLAEMYASGSTTPTPAVTSLTATGAVQGATVVGTTSVTGAVVTSTGLATVGTAKLDTGTKTASATAGAVTLNKAAGVITSEALTTAAGAAYTLTLTDSAIAAADQVFASAQNGSNTQGWLHVESVTPGAGSVVVVVRNIHASEALNGTIKIAFASFKN